ncbi:conserved hypothetical protein [Xanthomonas citri pv. citri]|nr:conserved hypothetical protein [Xanthomonas citri pv. citri]
MRVAPAGFDPNGLPLRYGAPEKQEPRSKKQELSTKPQAPGHYSCAVRRLQQTHSTGWQVLQRATHATPTTR